MKEVETNSVTGKVRKNCSELETTERRWFYVAMSPSGTISKGEAETLLGFPEILSSAAIAWVDYVTRDFNKEAPIVAAQLSFSDGLATSLTEGSYLRYQDLDSEMGLKMPSIQVRQMDVEPYPLLFLMKKNFILTIHPLNVDRRFMTLRRYSETVLKKIPADANVEDKLTMLLMRIIDENNDHNFEHLRQIEERGDKLNETMTNPYTPRTELGPEIYHMKHALVTYLNALWDTVDVLHTLRYGDAELISNDPKLLEKMGRLVEDVNRHIGLAGHMSDVLASGLEVLQSMYSNQLQNVNNRLALVITYLTVIGTAVLVPNTLATILGNAVFDIGPKDLGWYLALMIGTTVAATGLVYWWVRRSRWLPQKID